MNNTIAFQGFLSLRLPKIINNKDYREYKDLLTRIDEILRLTGMDLQFAGDYVSNITNGNKIELKPKQLKRYTEHAITGLRCMILKQLLGADFRELSVRLAESSLLRWFSQIGGVDTISVPSKSQLHRYSTLVSEDYLRNFINELFDKTSAQNNILSLRSPFTGKDIYLDATCLKANIHFPVDWLLLRDGMLSLLRSMLVIRKHGLKHRMQPPEKFINRVNGLCIEMSNSRRQKNSKNRRKEIFRQLKKIAKVIRAHAYRYYELLENEWQSRTDLTEGQAREVLRRMDNVLVLLPEAIKQAHSRIITGLQIESKNKILSLFDDSARVITRGKSGAEVEFGNTLFLAEQSDGFILDWKLYKASAPSDAKMTVESIERIKETSIEIESVAGDRGCDSAKTKSFLAKNEIANNICPRNPHELIQKLESKEFRFHQNRRSQTEGRIGIFKNQFAGSPIRNKIFEYKEISVAWAVLAHNFWVLARLEYNAEAAIKSAA